MKNTVLLFGLLFIAFSGFAQDKNALLGKWAFKEVYEKEKSDKPNPLAEMFSTMTVEFKDKEVLLTIMERTESAQWAFSEKDPKSIVVTSQSGKATEMNIIKLDEKELIITFGRAGAMVLTKA